MSFIKVYIHFVWSTENRISFLAIREIRQTVWNHIKENAKEKGVQINFINGYSNHCHCLIMLRADQTINKVMELIQEESTFWFNKNGILDGSSPIELPPTPGRTINKFEWQDDYFAVTVSESVLERIGNHNRTQEQHDSKKTFDDEYDEYIIKYGFDKFTDIQQ